MKFPIINLGTATNCPSRKWCPFDRDNHKRLGHKICYAQRDERQYKDYYRMNKDNEVFVKHYNFSDTLQDLAQYKPQDGETQPGEQMRKYTQALKRQSRDWRALV